MCKWIHITDNDITDSDIKEVIIKYIELLGGIKNEIKAINGDKDIPYDKHFMSTNLIQTMICH